MVDFQERDTTRGGGGASDRGEGGEDRYGESERDRGHDHDGDDHEGHDHAHDHHGDDHDHHAHDVETLGVAVVTVSSTRTLDDDPGGDAAAAAFEAEGHEVATRELVGDSHDRIQSTVGAVAGRGDVDVVVTTGGTGITPDDVTPEAVSPLFDKRLPGFGELFRRRSTEQIGTRTIASRATAGVVDGTLVFCLPGSVNAVELGVGEVVLPEAGHLVGLARRDEE